MNKKNPYKFTISFNENNPQHLQAATVLNQYSRGEKADYLARAIAAYEGMENNGVSGIDRIQIMQLIRQVLAEEQNEISEPKTEEEIQDVSEQTKLDVSASLLKHLSRNMSAFRK